MIKSLLQNLPKHAAKLLYKQLLKEDMQIEEMDVNILPSSAAQAKNGAKSSMHQSTLVGKGTSSDRQPLNSIASIVQTLEDLSGVAEKKQLQKE